MKKLVLLALLLYMIISYTTNVQAQNDTNNIVENNTNGANNSTNNTINIVEQSTNGTNNGIISNENSGNINENSGNINENSGNINENSGNINEKNRSKITIKIYRRQRKSQIFEVIFFLSIIMVIIYILKRKDM